MITSFYEQAIGRALRERKHKPSSFPLDAAASPDHDLVGHTNSRRIEADITAQDSKTCLGCGAKFTTIPDGGLPCGH